MTLAPWAAASRAYSSWALIMVSLSPVHVACTSAARMVLTVISPRFALARRPGFADSTDTLGRAQWRLCDWTLRLEVGWLTRSWGGSGAPSAPTARGARRGTRPLPSA